MKELDTTFDMEGSPMSNHLILFNSVGGHLPKNFGFGNYINLDINQSRLNGNESPTPFKAKDFLPYLHERDKLNCLLTVPHKYDPKNLKEPSNPSLYYKSEKFNKSRLKLQQADRNKYALAKLLQHKSQEKSDLNFFEKDELIRKNAFIIQKKTSEPNSLCVKLKNLTDGEHNNSFHRFQPPERESPTISITEEYSPIRKNAVNIVDTSMITPSLLKYFQKDKVISRKAFSKVPSPDITLDNISVPSPKKSRSNSRTIIVKKKSPEDFHSFYNKIENSEESSLYVKFKNVSQNNMRTLNLVYRKFEEIKSQIKRKESPNQSPLLFNGTKASPSNFYPEV